MVQYSRPVSAGVGVRVLGVSGRPISRLVPIALVAVLGVLVVSAATAAPASRVYVTSDCNGAAFKPRKIVIACGDAGLIATKLKWSEWGASKAAGSGTGEEKICSPNCAEGRVGKGKMQVRLSRVRLCSQDGKRHFTKLHYSWPNGAPGEGPKQGTIPIPCSLLSSY
jgi:hypothetical protein